MIEVTCAACGTLNRIAESDVAPGAKFANCTSCKSRMALPVKAPTGAIPKVPPIPTAPIPKVPPAIPPIGGRSATRVDLADLPAPKRTSPLATLADSKPAPRSALADAELPAPKAQPKAGAAAPLDLDDLMPADLPAPKPKTMPVPKVAPSAAGEPGITDLPAPKQRTIPVPKVAPVDAGLADLPAPKPKSTGARPTIDDDILDLPRPEGRRRHRRPPDAEGHHGPADAEGPARDRRSARRRRASPICPMPKPGANSDLPAPKGFFDDLPQPAKGGGKGAIDLPAPKGFFDDLPQPAKPGKPDLPAPKGFFDDLPQPAKAAKPELPAPKGFFDDLPQPAAKGGVFDDMPEPPKTKGGRELSSSDSFTPPQGTEIELDGPSLTGGKPLELADSAGPELDLERTEGSRISSSPSR